MNKNNTNNSVEPSQRQRAKGSPIVVPLSTYKLPAEGTHPATIVGVYDTGTHRTKNGKMLRQVVISFELADVRKRNGDPVTVNVFAPMWLTEGYPIHDLIVGLKGNDAVQELGHSLGRLCGEQCIVEVYHAENKNSGRKNADINLATIAPSEEEIPPPITPLVEYSVVDGMGTKGTFGLLPGFAKTLAATSEEIMHPSSVETAEDANPREDEIDEENETPASSERPDPIDLDEINRRLQDDVFGVGEPE
jgi:hypothetical protein